MTPEASTPHERMCIMNHQSGRRLAALFLLLLGALVVNNTLLASAKSAVNLDQCANLTVTCDTSNPAQWQNGNLNASNSHYSEGESVPYRARFTDLSPGQMYSATIEWDTTQQGKHAIDYLTGIARTETTADPCSGLSCAAPVSTLPIPVDPEVTGRGVTQVPGQAFRIDGGTFPAPGASIANTGNLCGASTCTVAANPTPYSLTGLYTDNSSTSTKVYFTAVGSIVVLSWGGHVASQADWGVDKSAASISGSPYHMRVLDFACSSVANCGAGNEDRSMANTAVLPPVTTTTAVVVTTTTVPEVTTTTTVPETTTTTEAPTTTTTEAPTTTTTLAPTTTTTLAPTTTTTLPPTTTTAPASTTTVAGSTTTVATSTTTSSVAATSTTSSTVAPIVTTTIPGSDFQVIFPPTTLPADDDFFALFPDSLPSTGLPGYGLGVIGIFLVLLGVAALPATRRRRGHMQD